jgi:hypothetical protein
VVVHVTSWAIHILIALAIIITVWNLLAGQRRAA